MLSALQKLVGKKKDISAHQVISLHSRVHRIMKNHLKSFLLPSKLSLLDWNVLGLLIEKEEGLRFSKIAKHLATEASFITELIQKLSKQHLVEITPDTKDRRVKIARLADKGKKIMGHVEKLMNSHIEDLFKDVTGSELVTYQNVMRKVSHRQSAGESGV